jgi:hypothetical protein
VSCLKNSPTRPSGVGCSFFTKRTTHHYRTNYCAFYTPSHNWANLIEVNDLQAVLHESPFGRFLRSNVPAGAKSQITKRTNPGQRTSDLPCDSHNRPPKLPVRYLTKRIDHEGPRTLTSADESRFRRPFYRRAIWPILRSSAFNEFWVFSEEFPHQTNYFCSLKKFLCITKLASGPADVRLLP